MSEKEYIFVGTAQLKTRDYIHQLEKENREKDKEIDRLQNMRLKAIEWVKKNKYYFPRPDELINILELKNGDKDV